MSLTSRQIKDSIYSVVGLLLITGCGSGGRVRLELDQFKNCAELSSYYKDVSAKLSSPDFPQAVGSPVNQSAEGGRSSQTQAQTGLEEGDVAKIEGNILVTLQYGKVHLVNISNPQAMSVLKTFDYTSDSSNLQQIVIVNGVLFVIGTSYLQTQSLFVDAYSLTAPYNKIAAHSIDGWFEQLRVSADQSQIYLLTSKYPDLLSGVASAEASIGKVVSGSTQKPSCLCDDLYYVPSDAIAGSPSISHIHSLSTTNPTAPLNQQFSMIGAGAVLRATEESFLLAFELDQRPAIELIPLGAPSPIIASANRSKSLIVMAQEEAQSLQIKAAGLIDGSVISQFSMASQGDTVNVFSYDVETSAVSVMPGVASASSDSRPQQQSILTTLQVQEGALIETQRIDELGVGERLFSAMFGGSHAYAVTSDVVIFSDPLYSFDISNFSSPQVVGELKIDGYSQWMHETPAGHVLALGREAPNGNIGGIHASLFSSNAQLVSRQIIGTSNTFSEAVNPLFRNEGYKSYLYDAPAGLLFLPTSSANFGFGGRAWTELTVANKVEIFQITASAVVPMATISTDHYVNRILKGLNAYYFLNEGKVYARSLANPASGLGTVSLPL
jgi:hypothetical protein